MPLSTTPAWTNSRLRVCVRVNETPPPAGGRLWELLTRRSWCGTPRSSRFPVRVICRNVRLSTCVMERRVSGAASKLTSCCAAPPLAGATLRFVATRGVFCYSRRPRIDATVGEASALWPICWHGGYRCRKLRPSADRSRRAGRCLRTMTRSVALGKPRKWSSKNCCCCDGIKARDGISDNTG